MSGNYENCGWRCQATVRRFLELTPSSCDYPTCEKKCGAASGYCHKQAPASAATKHPTGTHVGPKSQ